MEALKELFESISPGRRGHDPDSGEEDEAPTRRAETGTSRVASDVDPMAQENPEDGNPSVRRQRSQAGSSRQYAR